MPINSLVKKLRKSVKILNAENPEAKTFMIALLKRITTNQDMADSSGKRVPHYKLK